MFRKTFSQHELRYFSALKKKANTQLWFFAFIQPNEVLEVDSSIDIVLECWNKENVSGRIEGVASATFSLKLALPAHSFDCL